MKKKKLLQAFDEATTTCSQAIGQLSHDLRKIRSKLEGLGFLLEYSSEESLFSSRSSPLEGIGYITNDVAHEIGKISDDMEEIELSLVRIGKGEPSTTAKSEDQG